jgi:hypothetical protein
VRSGGALLAYRRELGLAIRRGQDAGEIAKRGDIGGVGSPGVLGSIPGSLRSNHLGLPSSFVAGRDELPDIYALTDGVSDAAPSVIA